VGETLVAHRFGLGATAVIVAYSFFSTDSLVRALVNTSSPVFLSVRAVEGKEGGAHFEFVGESEQ